MLKKQTEDYSQVNIPSEEGLFPLVVSMDGWYIFNEWSNRRLSLQSCKKGYLRVWATATDGKRRTFLVQRLVTMLYLDCPENHQELEVNHKDGNKENNHFSNLEWVTHAYNMKHALDNGLWNKDMRGKHLIPRDNGIMALLKNGTSKEAIEIGYQITRPNLNRIIRKYQNK